MNAYSCLGGRYHWRLPHVPRQQGEEEHQEAGQISHTQGEHCSFCHELKFQYLLFLKLYNM